MEIKSASTKAHTPTQSDQRKGLGLTVPTADGSPRFVLKIEPVSNTVVVGAREDLAITTMRWRASSVAWSCRYFRSTSVALFKFVLMETALPCTYSFDGTLLVATLDEPLLGLATGQAMVIYDGDRVVGSATICETQ